MLEKFFYALIFLLCIFIILIIGQCVHEITCEKIDKQVPAQICTPYITYILVGKVLVPQTNQRCVDEVPERLVWKKVCK